MAEVAGESPVYLLAAFEFGHPLLGSQIRVTEGAHLAHEIAFAVGDLPADFLDRSLPRGAEQIVRLRSGDSENVDHTSLARDGRGSDSGRLELGRGGDHDFVVD